MTSYLVPCNGGKEDVISRGLPSVLDESNFSLVTEVIIGYNDDPKHFPLLKEAVEEIFQVKWTSPITELSWKGRRLVLANTPNGNFERYKNSAIEKNRLFANSTGDTVVFADPEIQYAPGDLTAMIVRCKEQPGGLAVVLPENILLKQGEKDLVLTRVMYWYSVCFTRKLYLKLGGLDNWYSEKGGWGCEDDDMAYRLNVVNAPVIFHPCTVTHLRHPRVYQIAGHDPNSLAEMYRRHDLLLQGKLDFRSSQLQQDERWFERLKFI